MQRRELRIVADAHDWKLRAAEHKAFANIDRAAVFVACQLVEDYGICVGGAEVASVDDFYAHCVAIAGGGKQGAWRHLITVGAVEHPSLGVVFAPSHTPRQRSISHHRQTFQSLDGGLRLGDVGAGDVAYYQLILQKSVVGGVHKVVALPLHKQGTDNQRSRDEELQPYHRRAHSLASWRQSEVAFKRHGRGKRRDPPSGSQPGKNTCHNRRRGRKAKHVQVAERIYSSHGQLVHLRVRQQQQPTDGNYECRKSDSGSLCCQIQAQRRLCGSENLLRVYAAHAHRDQRVGEVGEIDGGNQQNQQGY